MKYPLCFTLSFVFLFAACQNKIETPINNKIVVTGEVQNPKNGKLHLFSNGPSKDWNVEEGKFIAKFESHIPMTFIFFGEDNNWQNFATPGDSIHITFDAENFKETLTYTGDHSEENAFLQQYHRLKTELEGDRTELYSLAEVQFIEKVTNVEETLLENIRTLKLEKPEIDAQFIQLMEAEAYYDRARALFSYKNLYKRYTQDTSYTEGLHLKAAQETIVIENPDALGSYAYSSFLGNKNWRFGKEIQDANPEYDEMESSWFFAEMKAAEERFESQEIQDHLKYSTLSNFIMYAGPEKVEQIAIDFMGKTENQTYINELKGAIRVWDNLRPGMQAPDFRYPNIENVSQALSDFKGKYVYVDVWATWCKPCLAEQPALAEIEHHYKDNPNIVFMGVSIDEDADAWRKMVKKKELGGVQLIADNAWESKINEEYIIKGIPRFILIDKEGKLIDATADSPSSDAIKKLLKNLLETSPVIGG